jgi:hypothetical protein
VSNARAILEAESPKKALRSMAKFGGSGKLDRWVNQNFLQLSDRFIVKRPFRFNNVYPPNLKGLFWLYRMHSGDPNGPTQLSCSVSEPGRTMFRKTFDFISPRDLRSETPVDVQLISLLKAVIDVIENEAQHPPDLPQQRLLREFEIVVDQAFRYAKQQYKQLQREYPSLWAT